jgi:hypothetical protein
MARVLTAVVAALVGAAGGAFLAAELYLAVRAPTGCDDVVHPDQNLSCALPTAPWWLLLGAAILGGSAAAAVALGPLRTSRRRRPGSR